MADRLMLSLLRAGAKASKIANLCRAEKTLFSILVQEKGKLQSDKLDFKTLADVFIQQVAKSEISSQCPEIGDRVFGEENNQFTNTLGETITVEVKQTQAETTKLLTKVLDGNEDAAKLFAETAHSVQRPIAIEDDILSQLAQCALDINDLGIWIDPIDATSQYVLGNEDMMPNKQKVYNYGVQCVTVLIGAYNIATGLPVMGVIYQPFHTKTQGSWQSKCYWGFCFDGIRLNNLESTHQDNISARSEDANPVVVASHSDKTMCDVISGHSSLTLCTASGAGYKCLCVIEGLVDAYLYSRNACYTWDTCAAHAILLSLDGGMTSFKEILKDHTTKPPLIYNKPNPQGSSWAHLEGTVAYSRSEKSARCLNETKKLQSFF